VLTADIKSLEVIGMAVNTFPNFSIDPYDFKFVNMRFKTCFNELIFIEITALNI
jgi:hypothetical protein